MKKTTRPKRTTILVAIRLNADEQEILKALAHKWKTSKSEILRRGLWRLSTSS